MIYRLRLPYGSTDSGLPDRPNSRMVKEGFRSREEDDEVMDAKGPQNSYNGQQPRNAAPAGKNQELVEGSKYGFTEEAVASPWPRGLDNAIH